MTQNPYESTDIPRVAATLTNRKRFPLLEVFAVIGILAVLVALLLPAIRSGPEAGTRVRCLNNVKMITLALLSCADNHKACPPAYTVDADGNRLHSWRTLLLPYLDQQELYASIDFSKPWNDPVNARAFNTQLEIFSCPSAELPPGFTTYLGNATTDGCFAGTRPRPLSEITDPHDQTILIAEVASSHAVHWMFPEDADENILLNFGPGNKTAHIGVVNAGFVDGRASSLSVDLDSQDRTALLTVSGDDEIKASEF